MKLLWPWWCNADDVVLVMSADGMMMVRWRKRPAPASFNQPRPTPRCHQRIIAQVNLLLDLANACNPVEFRRYGGLIWWWWWRWWWRWCDDDVMMQACDAKVLVMILLWLCDVGFDMMTAVLCCWGHGDMIMMMFRTYDAVMVWLWYCEDDLRKLLWRWWCNVDDVVLVMSSDGATMVWWRKQPAPTSFNQPHSAPATPKQCQAKPTVSKHQPMPASPKQFQALRILTASF